jgi:hypothetical protein
MVTTRLKGDRLNEIVRLGVDGAGGDFVLHGDKNADSVRGRNYLIDKAGIG